MAEEKFVVEEVLLEIARPELYRRNAFRIAELPVDALARDISRRQATIKQANSTGLPVPPGYGRALPLKERPDPDILSEAIQHLGDPERRLVDEVFWFWPRQFGGSRSDTALAALARGDSSMVYKFWRKQLENPGDEGNALHNVAVLSHASALDLEEVASSRALSNEERSERDFWWQEALRYWAMLVEDEAFWSRVMVRIRDLDDPRLTTGMARRMRTSLPQALLSINAKLAVRAAERNNTAGCQRQLNLMRRSGFGQDVVDEALRHAMEPIRERIKTLCKMVETQAPADPTKADVMTKRFLDQSQPLLATLDSLLPAGNTARDSMHDEVAQHALASLVVYGNKTENWQVVLPVIDRILPLAVGPQVRTRIEENRTSARNNLTLALCWYCGKNTPDKHCAYEVKMYGNVTRTPFWEYGRTGTHVQWQSGSVQVPRCTSCKAYHDSNTAASNRITCGGCLTGLLLGFVAAFLIVSALGSGVGANGFLIGLGIFVVINVITGSITLSLDNKRKKATKRPEIRPVNEYSTFPAIQLMLTQGWKVGEKPTA